jgi:hypothetical protein
VNLSMGLSMDIPRDIPMETTCGGLLWYIIYMYI